MLGIDRTAARYTFTAALVLLLLALVYLVRSTLFIFSLALLFAYLISPLVDICLDPDRRSRKYLSSSAPLIGARRFG